MRRLFCLIFPILSCAGCANSQLRYSTLKQAQTLSEIQHQQVLNNLAAFAASPSSIPFHINLKDGTAQVTDAGTIGGQLIRDTFLTLGGSRTVVDQWSMAPVTDDTSMRLLQVVYRRSLGSPEDLYARDFANDLAHDLKKQTTVVDDLRTTSEDDQFQLGRPVTDRAKVGFTDVDIEEARHRVESIISSNSDRIVLPGEILSDDNLVFTPIDPETGRSIPTRKTREPDSNAPRRSRPSFAGRSRRRTTT